MPWTPQALAGGCYPPESDKRSEISKSEQDLKLTHFIFSGSPWKRYSCQQHLTDEQNELEHILVTCCRSLNLPTPYLIQINYKVLHKLSVILVLVIIIIGVITYSLFPNPEGPMWFLLSSLCPFPPSVTMHQWQRGFLHFLTVPNSVSASGPLRLLFPLPEMLQTQLLQFQVLSQKSFS